MPNLPHLAVGEDHPFDALVHGAHLHVPELTDTELLSAPLYFDEGDHLFVNANAIVSKIALNQVFAGAILALVEPKAMAKKVCYKQSCISLICVTLNKILEIFVEFPYCNSNSFSCSSLPLWSEPLSVLWLADVDCLNYWL
jgi:hypothetical protein